MAAVGGLLYLSRPSEHGLLVRWLNGFRLLDGGSCCQPFRGSMDNLSLRTSIAGREVSVCRVCALCDFLCLGVCGLYCWLVLMISSLTYSMFLVYFAGAIGYMGTSAFVRKIYTNVKID